MARLNDNLFTTLCDEGVGPSLAEAVECNRKMRESARHRVNSSPTNKMLQTRFGWVQLRFSDKGLSSLEFVESRSGRADSTFRDAFMEWLQIYQAADAAIQWSYLDLKGTEFQRSVWRQLVEIPFGGTTSYGAIAEKVGRPKAYRAVGSAVGANPISILVPCHRVLPSTGRSGNYRWGPERKTALLDAELESGSDLCALFE